MNRKGVSYDVGRVLGVAWRPHLGRRLVHRELQIIRDDLHCNAVRICGVDIARLTMASEEALEQGLEVWLSPELWDKDPRATLEHVVAAARAAEPLRRRWPERLVLSVGSELTLFMRGIVEGRSFVKRLGNPSLKQTVEAGRHNEPLNAFLAQAVAAVRQVFGGPVTYASLPWETVDWSLFDLVGIDHYRDPRIRDRYVEMLQPLFGSGKPVVITEFGCRTYQGALDPGAMGREITDGRTLFFHQLPVVGRFVRPRLNGNYVRDEELPARELIESLGILDQAGVDGAFVMTFVSPIATYDQNPRYDLDMAGFSLVKSFAGDRKGTTYPDMPWEPKASFRAVAAYFAR
jgi:hypothetical protein